MGFNLSTNMNLPVPQVGAEAGPQYAQDVNNCLTLVDQHNHSLGYGVAISPNGININADLPFNANNLTTARSVRFTPQSATLSALADIGCLYEVTNDLYYNDGLGNQIRLTQAGGIVGTSGSIANLVAPASATYVSLTQTIVFQSNTNTAANLDAGFIILRTAAANSPGLTLSAPASISSDYGVALPLLPMTTLPVQIDSSGNMSAAPVTAAQLASDVGVNPTGSIIMYGGASAPSNYLMCDGTSYLRSTWPALFSAIGTAFGSADGTHFNVPDMRGQFPRGVDNGAGRDPDTTTRTAMNPGGNTGDNVGSIQPDGFKSHAHSFAGEVFNVGGAGLQAGSGLGFIINPNTDATGGAETRPTNAYVNFIIKT